MKNSNDKRNYRIDFATMTLIMTAEFAKAANIPGTAEYKTLRSILRDFPNLKMSRKTHATPKSYISKSGEQFKKNQFSGLTYEAMERFIDAIPDHEEYSAQYDYAKDIAENLGMVPYVLARQWFLAQFPKYRKNALAYLSEHPNLVLVADLINLKVSEIKTEVSPDATVTPATLSVKKSA